MFMAWNIDILEIKIATDGMVIVHIQKLRIHWLMFAKQKLTADFWTENSNLLGHDSSSALKMTSKHLKHA